VLVLAENCNLINWLSYRRLLMCNHAKCDYI
jgi:hypothetical protein